MELQSLRYAAMISAMTFERAVEVYSEFLKQLGRSEDAQTHLLDFLEWEQPDEDSFAQEVRIVLVSAEFSRELTTCVIWLNEQGLDISCIRIKPYSDNGRILADIQQIIPLPETEDYQVRIKEKQQRERAARKKNLDLTKFDVTIGNETIAKLPKRTAILTIVRFLTQRGYSPLEIADTVPWRKASMFHQAQGELGSAEFIARQKELAAAGGRAFDERRFYCDDEDLLHFDQMTFAFTNQWGPRTPDAMDQLIAAFPRERISYQISE